MNAAIVEATTTGQNDEEDHDSYSSEKYKSAPVTVSALG